MLDSAAIAIIVLIATALVLKYLLSPKKARATEEPAQAAEPSPAASAPPQTSDSKSSESNSKVFLCHQLILSRCIAGR
jgi:hypothetical protein